MKSTAAGLDGHVPDPGRPPTAAAEGDGNEGAENPGAEVPPPDPGQRQLEADHGGGEQDGGAVGGDEERQRVQDAAEDGAGAGDGAARQRVAAPGQVAGVGEPSENAMLTPAPSAAAALASG